MQRRGINVFLLNYCYYAVLYSIKNQYYNLFWLKVKHHHNNNNNNNNNNNKNNKNNNNNNNNNNRKKKKEKRGVSFTLLSDSLIPSPSPSLVPWP